MSLAASHPPVPYANARRLGAAALALALSAAAAPSAARAQAQPAGPAAPASDSVAVARTVARFHEALAAGDSAGVLALLAPDATILESGGVETRNEYRGHHLPGDIGFARAVKTARGPMRVTVRGDVAWAASTSTANGEYRGRAVNSAGAELMVLTRAGDGASGWHISAIHWSSRTRRP